MVARRLKHGVGTRPVGAGRTGLRGKRMHILVGLTALVLSPAGALAARHATGALDPALAAKLDPRLIPVALAPAAEEQPLWVSFADKGERDPAELAAALARAEAELTPRNRARRVRGHVWPLADYRDLPLFEPYLDELRARGLRAYATSRWLNSVAVRVPGSRLAEIARLPFVDRLSPVERATRAPDLPAGEDRVPPLHRATQECLTPNLVDHGQTQTELDQIQVAAMHDSGYIGTGVLVCILDEGFNFHHKHEALRDVVIAPGFERDFVEGDSVASDTTNTTDYRHGTWVMGCLAGNKPGTYLGSAYGAQFALGRTENAPTEHQVEMVYWGMGAEWADSLGADLINSSLGYSTFDPPDPDYTPADLDGHTTIVSRAAEIAASKGLVVVNAAGNEGSTAWQKVDAPADVNGDSLTAVGAVDASGSRAYFSSVGPTADGRIKPDVCALGVSNPLVSASGNPQAYTMASGTSFATPLVAGLAACLLQARPSFPATWVIRAIRETASQAATPDNLLGYGIANGLATLRWLYPGASVPPAPAGVLGLSLLGPNPLRGCSAPTRVRFALGDRAPASARARVVVFDAQGRAVRELFDGVLVRGQWAAASWDGSGKDGRDLGAGVYFIGLEAAGEHAALRVVSLH